MHVLFSQKLFTYDFEFLHVFLSKKNVGDSCVGKLDNCSQLWSPSDQEGIAKLETVARHFTAQVAGLEGLDYWERLAQLKLYSQERRRERYQIIYIWKVSQLLVFLPLL